MTERLPPPTPPAGTQRSRRVDPWLIGLAAAGVAVLALFAFGPGGSTRVTTTTTTQPPPPEGEAAILASARLLTREQEGLQVRPYHPAPESGVSIGFGYDMRERTTERVRADLATVTPPITQDWIDALAEAAGLTGSAAQAFVDDHGVIFLTLEQADSLFDVTYAEETLVAREFATAPSHLTSLGVDYAPVPDWNALHPAIRGILIDLKFRGDYRPWWAEQQPLQDAVAANDPFGVLDAISDTSAFPDDLAGSVRFHARVDWLSWVLGA